MKVLIPFEIEYTPIKRLSLINFEKKPDEIYRGFEMQYIDCEHRGKGYRIIAYRKDNYIDVYDEKTLKYDEKEAFDVAEKGLNQHMQVEMSNLRFESTAGKVHMTFCFEDIYGRKIDVSIKEQTDKKSISMNLLAPIGAGSVKPSSLPMFFLYDFDFVRKNKTIVNVFIDKKKMKLDNFPFPVPMNMQWRYYTRYTPDSQIIELFKSVKKKIEPVELDENGIYLNGAIEYKFQLTDGKAALFQINIKNQNHPFSVEFQPVLSLEKSMNGSFTIEAEKCMGHIKGSYDVKRKEGKVKIDIIPDGGWTSVPTSRLVKMITGPKSIFSCWSKKYKYEQSIDLHDYYTESKWINGNIGL